MVALSRRCARRLHPDATLGLLAAKKTTMTTEAKQPLYEMTNVQFGHVMIEHDIRSRAVQAYFSADAVPPREEYRDGAHFWKHSGMAQSFRFDVRNTVTGQVTSFKELFGLLYFARAKEDSELYKIGDIAQDQNISIYVAMTDEGANGKPVQLSADKLRVLNALYNDRLRTAGKKILILPDIFDLHRQMSYGEIMIDFGLTSLQDEEG